MLIGRYKTKHAPFARRKCEDGGWGWGRREAERSCSPGKCGQDLKYFLSCSVKSLVFSTVLLLGSFCVLKVGFLIFIFVLQVPEKSAIFLRFPASFSGPEVSFLQLQYCFPESL